jgi:hypothetical protein
MSIKKSIPYFGRKSEWPQELVWGGYSDKANQKSVAPENNFD